MSAPDTKKLLVLFFDRLPIRWIGGYGCDWVETPEFDRIISESLVFDQFFTVNRKSITDSWADTFLDAIEVSPIPLAEEFIPISSITGTMKASEEDEPSEEEAATAAVLERMIDFLKEEDPGVFWIYVEAELETRLLEQQPDDKEPNSEPILELMKQADFLIGLIAEMLVQNGLRESVTLVVTSREGVPLPDRKSGDLTEDTTHLPLCIRNASLPGGERRSQLCEGADLEIALLKLMGIEAEHLGIEQFYHSDDRELHPYLFQRSDDALAVRHPHWLYIKSREQPDRLYRKPGDRWEVNNLAGKFVDWCELATRFVIECRNAEVPPPLPAELLDIRFTDGDATQ